MSRSSDSFSNWSERDRLIIERHRAFLAAPRDFGGQVWHSMSAVMAETGLTRSKLTRLVQTTRGANCVLLAPCGIRFVRLPRHDGDERAPVYFDVESVRKMMRP